MTASWGRAGQPSALGGFAIDIDDFEGPFDLLLRLIETQGLDITGVSLLAVTDQFIAYTASMRDRFAEAASEFLLVASRLALLKSRALLPRLAPEDDGETLDDLAERLRVYAAFKTLAAQLDEQLDAGRASYVRAAAVDLPDPEPAAGEGDLAKLLAAMQRLAQGAPAREGSIAAPAREYPVPAKIRQIEALLAARRSVSFEALAAACASRAEVVATFLAVLHVVTHGTATVQQAEHFGPITLTAARASAPAS